MLFLFRDDLALPTVQIDERGAGIVYEQMVPIEDAFHFMRNANGLRQAEVMLTDDIAVRNDVIILLFEFLRQGNRATAIRVVQIMELLLRVIVQRVHAIHVRREDDDLNLQIQNVILIVIPVHIGVPDALIAEACFRQAELPLDVGIRGREKIVDRVVVDRPSKHIKYLCAQFELKHLSGKVVICALTFQQADVLLDLFDDIGNDRFLRVHVDTGLRQETSQRVHGFEIIGDAHSTHVVCQNSCVIDGLHHGFAVNVRNDRRLRGGRGLCRLCSGWPCRRSCLCRIALRCGLRRQFRRYRPLRHRLRRLCRSFSAGRLCRGSITVAERVEHGQLVRIFIALPARLARRRLISRPQAQRVIVAASQFLGFDVRWNGRAFLILQRLYHIIDGRLIKLRQIQMHVVQRLVHVDVLLGGCAHHSAQKLRDIGVIHCTAEGHHNLCSRAVPSCGQRLLEENNLDALVVGNAARLAVRHIQTADLNRRCTLAEGVDDLPFQEPVAHPFLYDAKAFIQISGGDLVSAAVLHLDHKNRIYLSVVLLIAILIPVLTFLLPLIRGRLQHCHIISAVLGVGDDDPIFQKSRCTHLVRRRPDIMRGRLDALCQAVEALRRSRHADDHRHRRQSIRLGALQELLHDGGVFCEISCALRTTMGFVNDEVQPVALLSHGV